MMNRTTQKLRKPMVLLALAGLFLAGAASVWSLESEAQADQAASASSEIKGRILDYETRRPLAGVAVSVVGSDKKTSSDQDGRYALGDIPLGFYALSFERDGYYSETRADVIVRSGRTTFLNLDLVALRTIHKEVSVTADFFSPAPDKPVSQIQFNAEELRRDAASASDVSRALYLVPGVVKADEEANDLIVRGGSPMENGFYVDNIFMPNINHFPQQGASGGNISMLNMDFIETLEVSTGGFDATYGNRLSSIIDIRYREGNRERFNGQLNLSVIGIGAQLEGPLGKGKGSWMLSGNRNSTAVLSKVLDMGNPSHFFDLQGKAVYDLGPNDRLSLLAIGGGSGTEYGQGGAERFGYGTAGVTWRHLWGGKGYSDTSLSTSSLNGTESEFWEWAGILHEQYDYGHQWLSFRNVSRLSLSPSFRLVFGVEAQSIRFRNWDDYEDVERRLRGTSAAAFATVVVHPFHGFSLSSGLRLDYVPFSRRYNLSPRLSFHWTLSSRLSVNGAYGIFTQQIPLVLIQQDRGNAGLRDPRARHLVLGLKYLLAKDTQMTLEAYDKAYNSFPMAPDAPYDFIIDDVNGDNDRFGYYGPLVAEGKAYARGVELTVQKKISKKLYGLANLTYYRARYRDLFGTWRNRLFDNRFILCLSGGYKFSRKWEMSARWIWSGNRAFTPVDEDRSIRTRQVWIDPKDTMTEHLNDYRSLYLRFDRRYQFKKSNLVVYFGALNAFGHKNELYRFWDIWGNQYLSGYMWEAVPYFGLEFEF